ncbi:MAG: AAA family ATPase [Muribaculaceae bacterium]|nr:AAA family ATPase [Muribaculaceae bacterium]
MMEKEFKNQLMTAIISCPIVYIPHFHIQFIEEQLSEIICQDGPHRIFDNISLENNVIEFDCGRQKVVNFSDKKLHNDYDSIDEVHMLLVELVMNNLSVQPTILLLKDFSILHDPRIQSLLTMFALRYEKGEYDHFSTIIIVSPQPVTALPCEIEKYITVIDIKAPGEKEIKKLLKGFEVPNSQKNNEEKLRTDLCRTLQGLQKYDIKQILKSTLVRTGNRINETTIRLALEEKKSIVRKSGIIEVIDADEDFSKIGGLEVLKQDLERKAVIFKNLNEAQDKNVNIPKGMLIIGMPGCGKTMIAKSVANEFGVSLLRLDVNRLMGKYVGESENNLRQALATAESAHPCVLWIDEIEKAFAGSNSYHNNDMLVMRLMGHFLTWMQEHKTPVFIVATANDVMRPEFMRKGRFDEVYFVGFPNEKERLEILKKTLKPYRSSIFDIKFTEVDEESHARIVKDMIGAYGGFSGAEIKCVVDMVMEKKFVEYIKAKDSSHKPSIDENDFEEAVKELKDSVMANQQSVNYLNQELRRPEEWTNIERIIEMQKKYKFKDASEKSSEKTEIIPTLKEEG